MIYLRYLLESCSITGTLIFINNILIISITALKGYRSKAQNVPQKTRYHILNQFNPKSNKTIVSPIKSFEIDLESPHRTVSFTRKKRLCVLGIKK